MGVRDDVLYRAYCAAAYAAAPLAALYLLTRPKHRALLQRFAPPVPALPERPVWVHACSVGEVQAARPILDGVHARWPHMAAVLSVSTASGYAMAKHLRAPWLHVTRFPVDLPCVARRFIQELNPRVLMLIETELWPATIREARRHGAPVLLISGRLSSTHTRRYYRLRWLFSSVLHDLTALGVQTELYAQRFAAIGAPRESITVTGNVKFDGVVTEIPGAHALRRLIHAGAEVPVVVFGSTRPGDEALAYRCWVQWRREFPTLRLIVAPRHLDRLDEAVAAIPEPVTRKSMLAGEAKPAPADIIILDTMGELIRFYAIATVAVVGGSFYPGVEGHNPLEPAALGVPTVFGPYMGNFAEPAAMLLDRNGAVQVAHPEAAASAVAELLRDPAKRKALARAARETVLANRGAIEKTLDLVQKHLADATTV